MNGFLIDWLIELIIILINIFIITTVTEGGGVGGVGRSSAPQIYFINMPFFSMGSLDVLFLKEVTKNVHESQYTSK